MLAFIILCISVLFFCLLMIYLIDGDFRKFVNYSFISKYNYLEMKNSNRCVPVCTDCHRMEMKFKKIEKLDGFLDIFFYVFECPRCKGTKILNKKGYDRYEKEMNKREYDKSLRNEYNSFFRLNPMSQMEPIDWANFGSNIISTIRKTSKSQSERIKMYTELLKSLESKSQEIENDKTNSSI